MPPEAPRRPLRLLALLALFIAACGLFAWLRFPAAALKNALESAANRQLAPEVACRIATVEPALPPALQLNGLTLSTTEPGEGAVFLDGGLRVRPLLFPLLTGRGLVFSLAGKAYGGSFSARARLKNGERLAFVDRLVFDHLDLAQNEYLGKIFKSPAAGILRGEIVFPAVTATGKAAAAAELKFSIHDAALPFASPLPGLAAFSFTGIKGKAHFIPGGIKVEMLELDSSLVTMKLAGNITPGGAGTETRLLLAGEMLPKSGKNGNADIFFATLRSRQDKAGIPIRITGGLKNPEIHFSSPSSP